METCRVEGCGSPVYVKKHQLCQKHYARWHRHGDPLAWVKPVRQLCSVEGCEFKAVAKGICGTHRARLKRYGTTDKSERPTVCAVEGCDAAVSSWGLCDRHYRRQRKGIDNERRCRFCGGLIDPNVHAQRLFCSKECSEREQYIRRRLEGRAVWLKQYGLTVAQFDAMLAEQDGRCRICRAADHNGRNWCVDHDHKDGRIRGLLCMDCNVGLGKFHDDPALLLAAIEYLAPVVVP